MFLCVATIVALSVCFTSCENEDVKEERRMLIGKWEAVAQYVLEDNEWILNYEYKEGYLIYTFKKNVWEPGMGRGKYTYDAKNKQIISPTLLENAMTVAKLTSDELEIVIDDGKRKIRFKKIV